MKNQILVIAALLAACYSNAFAQKVDLDKYKFTVGGVYVLPKDPLPEDYKTFNVKATLANSVGVSANNVEGRISIGGWNRLENNQKAHLAITINFDNLIIDKSEIAESKSESKDKAGKVTVTYSYKVNYAYSMGAGHKITDFNGKVLSSGLYLRPSGSFSSGDFSNYSAASSYKNDNNSALRDKFTNECIDRYTSQVSNDMTSKWGLSAKNEYDHFWMMDSKKHPEQDSMQIMAKFMKEQMPMFRADVLASDFKVTMAPFIGYFERLAERYKADEKGDKKFRYSSYYNLAKLYYYFDDLDKSDEYADKLIKNDYDKGDGEDFKKDNVKLREVFKKAKINKRHLVFDPSTFTGPK